MLDTVVYGTPVYSSGWADGKYTLVKVRLPFIKKDNDRSQFLPTLNGIFFFLKTFGDEGKFLRIRMKSI